MTEEYAYVGGESEGQRMDREYKKMIARDKAARDADTLVGRYLKERAADGYAFYTIEAINDDGSLVVENAEIYDGWTVPIYDGLSDCFPRAYALQNLAVRDQS